MPATVLVVEDERKLRRRIEADPGAPRVVHTVLGAVTAVASPAMTDATAPR
jgi:hypothetical protein